MRRCSQCILPESYPLIEFGMDGVCNVCQNAAPAAQFHQVLGEEALNKLVAPFRNCDKYGCLVGLTAAATAPLCLIMG